MSALASPIRAIRWNGGTIQEPGLYEALPIEVYHGDPDLCPGPSISSSGLRTIWSDGPAAFWVRSPLNPNRIEEEEKDHLNLGQAAHHLILSEGGFHEKFAVRPEQWKDWRKSEAKDWREDMRRAGKVVLTPEDLEQIKGMAGVLSWQDPANANTVPESGLANSTLVRQGLLHGLVEHSLIWRDAETGIWLRARPDVLSLASLGLVVDLKTCSTGRPEKAIFDHAYFQQGALVAEGLKAVLGIEMTSFVLVFAQTSAPFRVSVHELDPYEMSGGEMVDPIAIGMRRNREALRIFKRCLDTQSWPAGDGDSHPERMPAWCANQTMSVPDMMEEVA
ncbi:PD-(D/E)XK nuclease-like domain-containing protein [Acuticoccus sp. M5D2P5]|uniref:PD-(D/E)XK nuclease-like domain-containing protein n=1 Tax=Acuticoccus kalidii TaxID=2910977 RepID=UPI001F21698D|nr:PD-(D/E)XK nuclease-like domain-containing protein [Acuticoccus kalidii]MCF3932883.1 PD-(D/E)XK nuclease-like domain-containing protein [Acuticoccus kalidii]